MSEKIVRIRLNKNRGWRGLAELVCEGSDRSEVNKMIFSFSQAMWNDMLKGYIVAQDEDNFLILNFDNIERLPRPEQQRSVLIKSFQATVIQEIIYPKKDWYSNVRSEHIHLIRNFLNNKNNHTQSDWNCIGIRVMPNI